MISKNLRSIAVLIALVASAGLASANSVELISNLPANGGGVNGNVVINKQGWLAMSFTLPTGDHFLQISDIEVGLERVGHFSTSGYQFRVYTDLNNQPSKPVGSFPVPLFRAPTILNATTDFSATYTLAASRKILLTVGQTYWIVAYSINPSTTNDVAWITSTNPPDAMTLTGASFGTVLQSTDQGKTWTSFSAGVPSLKIDAVCD